jgi:hypothetical protein
VAGAHLGYGIGYINEGRFKGVWVFWHGDIPILAYAGASSKNAARGRRFEWEDAEGKALQCGFDLKAPCFEKRFGNVLGILVPARPLP